MITITTTDFDKVDWDRITKESNTATFFQTKDWLGLWVKHFNGGKLLYKLEDEGQTVGIFPLHVSTNTLTLLSTSPVLENEMVTDFGDVLLLPGDQQRMWETMVDKLKIDFPSHRLEFSFIREESDSYKALKQLGLRETIVDVSPFVDLPSSWEEYLKGLDRHDRHELRRKIKKLEREEAFKVCHEGDPADIDEFFRLMSLSKEAKHNFLSDTMKQFFTDVITHFWHKKMLYLCFLKLNGKNIATTLNFLYNNEVLLYNSGFDPEFSHLSPGFLLKAFIIKHSIEKGQKRFDFLRGGERYKYNLGAKERKLYKFSF